MMFLFARVMLVLFLLLQLATCQKSKDVAENRNYILSNNPVNKDFKTFVLGKWEGRAWYNGERNVLLLTIDFQTNGKMLVVETAPNSENPQNGKTQDLDYEFISDDVIKVKGYPDNLKIQKISDNEIKFVKYPPKYDEESVAIIYECRFRKLSEQK